MGSALTFMVQFGGQRFHPGDVRLVDPLILISIMVGLGAIVLPVIALTSRRVRNARHTRQAARRRLEAAAGAEQRARAMMSELCPYGWRAQITIHEAPDWQVPEGLEDGQVSLDWAELEPGTGRPLVLRHVSAPTIGEALDTMVAGRRTDETLEHIEQLARSQGILWPDL